MQQSKWVQILAIALTTLIVLIGLCVLLVYVCKGSMLCGKSDIYTTIWANALFPEPVKNTTGDIQCPIFELSTHVNVQFITNYHKHNISKRYDCGVQLHILLDGEPSDLKDYARNFDVVVSTKKTMTGAIYLPYYIYHCVESGTDIRNLDLKHLDYSTRKFAVFAYSNCDEKWSGVRNRKSFYYRLKQTVGDRLINAGRCYNENSKNFGGHHTNHELFRQFKFVISFENEAILGYISEKITNPIFAGCIPVYCGAPDVACLINPRRIINVSDFENFDGVIERMLELDRDPVLFGEIVSQPALVDIPSVDNVYSFLLGKGKIFKEIYDQAPATLRDILTIKRCVLNRIVCCTFADGTACTSTRLVKEATRSGYFDEIKAFGKDDLVGPDFDLSYTRKKTKKRGYGYYTWKPYIILKALMENCKEGDVLIFLDAGMHVRRNMGTVVMDYVTSVMQDKPLLAFPLLYRERFWTKHDLIDRVFDDCSIEFREACLARLPYQITSSVLVIRRCEQAIKMIALWSAIAQEQNHRYIDDSRSLDHNDIELGVREHRHDQSILSLLCKKENQFVNLCYDNQNDHPDSDHQRSVFRPKRWRK